MAPSSPKQLQLGPMLGALREPEEVPEQLIAVCKSFGDAVMLSLQLSHVSRADAAAAIGWSSVSQLTDVIAGRKHFPMGKARDWSYFVGNTAVQQWVAFDSGFRLVPRVESAEERVLRLERQVRALTAQQAVA